MIRTADSEGAKWREALGFMVGRGSRMAQGFYRSDWSLRGTPRFSGASPHHTTQRLL